MKKINRNKAFVIINAIVFFLSEREDFIKAFDLLMAFSIIPFLEGIYIISCIMQKYFAKLLHIESIL